MKKKILFGLAFMLFLCACIFALTACGDNEPPHTHDFSILKADEDGHWYECVCGAKDSFDGFIYKVSADGTHAEVIAYLGTSTKVNIASTYNGLPVTSIYPNAFENTAIKTVVIPDSVTNIGSDAFKECNNLTSIEIPGSVTSIGDGAFSNCPITKATISTLAISHINKSNLKEVLITSGENIPDSAFSGCGSLTSITILDSVTSIGSAAFVNCSSLTSITIPDSVTSIGACAFGGCSSLTSITIPDSVTSIGIDAFTSCSSLTSITIPDSVTSIGDGAFSFCRSLTSITIPDSVTSIGVSAFYYCSNLTSVTIPNSITNIGSSAFSGCDSLTSIKYRGTETQWSAINKGDYWDSETGSYTITYNYTDN